MGGKFRYNCGTCGYTTVVGGGSDCGFFINVQTGYCEECSDLVDFVTEIRSPDAKTEKNIVIGACFKCGKEVKQLWNDGEPCPQCGGEFDERKFVMSWD